MKTYCIFFNSSVIEMGHHNIINQMRSTETHLSWLNQNWVCLIYELMEMYFILVCLRLIISGNEKIILDHRMASIYQSRVECACFNLDKHLLVCITVNVLDSSCYCAHGKLTEGRSLWVSLGVTCHLRHKQWWRSILCFCKDAQGF